jgi:rod shape-determining protein MreC
MEYTPPQFFNRGPAPVVRLGFFVLLSIFLMVLDARFRFAEPLRGALSVAMYPMQQAAIAPFAAMANLRAFFTAQAQLRQENAELREERLKAAKDLLTLDALRSENERLRELMAAKQRVGAESLLAEVVYTGRDPFTRKVIVDKGDAQGVKTGQAVIDAQGVVGQVTRVHPLLAEVTLLTHKDHAIPVQIVRNGMRGVAYGSGDGATLDLRHMATNAEVQEGDQLVTSGLDSIYPAGLPVATVSKVERTSGFAFARIVLVPAAGIDRHRQLLILAQAQEAPSPPPAAEDPKTKGRAKRPPPKRGE